MLARVVKSKRDQTSREYISKDSHGRQLLSHQTRPKQKCLQRKSTSYNVESKVAFIHNEHRINASCREKHIEMFSCQSTHVRTSIENCNFNSTNVLFALAPQPNLPQASESVKLRSFASRRQSSSSYYNNRYMRTIHHEP